MRTRDSSPCWAVLCRVARAARAAEGDCRSIGVLGIDRGRCRRLRGRVPPGAPRLRLCRGPEYPARLPLAEGHLDRLPGLGRGPGTGGRRSIDRDSGAAAFARAAKDATCTIPIVVSASDPSRQGLVASLARPGGNVTGFSLLIVELMPKRLELLKETRAQAGSIASGAVNSDSQPRPRGLQTSQEAARQLGVAAPDCRRPAPRR